MKYTDDILQRYLQLDSISEQLETQCNKAKEESAKENFKPDGTPDTTAYNSNFLEKCYSFCISKIMQKHGGKWQPTLARVIKGGNEEFLNSLRKVLITNPYCIEIILYNQAGQTLPDYPVKIETNSDEQQQIVFDQKETKSIEKGSEKIATQLLELEHEREIDRITREYEKINDNLTQTVEILNANIDVLKEENKELEEELEDLQAESKSTLGSVTDEYKKLQELKTNPPYMTILGGILQQAAGGLILRHPACLDILSYNKTAKEELLKQLSSEMGEDTTPPQKELNAGFSETTADKSLEGKSENYKKIYTELDKFFKQLTDDEITIVYSLLCLLIKDNKIDIEKYKKVIGIMQDIEKTTVKVEDKETKEIIPNT